MEIVGSEANRKHAVVEAEQARWLAENQDAIDYYNAFVEKYGLFGDEYRQC